MPTGDIWTARTLGLQPFGLQHLALTGTLLLSKSGDLSTDLTDVTLVSVDT